MRQSSANLKALRDVCNVCFIIICILIYCFLRNVHKDIKRCVIGVYDSRGGGAAGNPVGNFSRRSSMWCATKLRHYLLIVKWNGVKILLKERISTKLQYTHSYSILKKIKKSICRHENKTCQRTPSHVRSRLAPRSIASRPAFGRAPSRVRWQVLGTGRSIVT